MTSRSVVAVSPSWEAPHVRRAPTPVSRWTANAVYQLACELGVEFGPLPKGLLHVEGNRETVLFLGPALRAHKQALLRGACVRCRYNLAERPNGMCRWCDECGERSYVYEPNSVAERAFLERSAGSLALKG